MSHFDGAAHKGARPPPTENEAPSVLMVDDDAAVLGGYARTLAQRGYRVETALDAPAALRALHRARFDVIVSDIQMPGMSGIDLLESMRADGLDTPVVFLTGEPDLDTAIRAVEGGVLRYLQKPIETEGLVRVMGEVVWLHGLARAKRLALDNDALRSLVDEINRSREATEAVSRSKSELLGKLSHELRTPLNAVIGFTDLALDAGSASDRREYLQTVKTSAAALLGILQSIVDASELDEGRARLQPSRVSLRGIVNATLQPLLARAKEKGLVLTSEIAADVPDDLLCDPARLGQVIRSLVDNAIKFTDTGEVTVLTEVELQSKRDVVLRMTISDTGCGIAADRQSTILEAFSQGDNSSTRQHGGVGLGLTIASQLVKLMAGELTLNSTPGVGSVFRCTLRLRRTTLP